MNKDDFFYLGKILKTYGNNGHLLILFDVDDPGDYQQLDTVFISINNELIPFTVRSVELRPKQQALLLLDDMNSADDAEVFERMELFLPLSKLPKLQGNKFYYHEITGFSVVDQHHGNIGILRSVIDLPQQSLMQIDHGNKEVLVPLNDETLIQVDREQKILLIRAPEGLIDIYL